MAAQKCKKIVNRKFWRFERLLTPNPSNQDSRFITLLVLPNQSKDRKSKNMGLQGIISA